MGGGWAVWLMEADGAIASCVWPGVGSIRYLMSAVLATALGQAIATLMRIASARWLSFVKFGTVLTGILSFGTP